MVQSCRKYRTTWYYCRRWAFHESCMPGCKQDSLKHPSNELKLVLHDADQLARVHAARQPAESAHENDEVLSTVGPAAMSVPLSRKSFSRLRLSIEQPLNDPEALYWDDEAEVEVDELCSDNSDDGDDGSNTSDIGTFEVEDIVSVRIVNGKREYRVTWEGYSEEEDTWECAAYPQTMI